MIIIIMGASEQPSDAKIIGGFRGSDPDKG